jgi:hypothetical protein
VLKVARSMKLSELNGSVPVIRSGAIEYINKRLNRIADETRGGGGARIYRDDIDFVLIAIPLAAVVNSEGENLYFSQGFEYVPPGMEREPKPLIGEPIPLEKVREIEWPEI